MTLPRKYVVSLACLALISALGCGAAPDDSASLGSVAEAQDNPPTTSSPDRCTVSDDRTGQNLGEGTVDQNGFCCVPQSDGRKTCYGCGSGYTCASIPSEIKPPPTRKPPIALPPAPPILHT